MNVRACRSLAVAALGLLGTFACGGSKGTLTVKIKTPPGVDDPFIGAAEVRMTIGDRNSQAPVMDGRFSVKIEIDQPSKDDHVTLTLEALDSGGRVIGRGRTPSFLLLPQNSEITVFVGRPGRVVPTEVQLRNEANTPAGRADLMGVTLRGRPLMPVPERGIGALIVGGVDGAGTSEPSAWLYDPLTHDLLAGGRPPRALRGGVLVPTADGDLGQQAILWGGAVATAGAEAELATSALVFDPNMQSVLSVFQPAAAEVAEAGPPGAVSATVAEVSVKDGVFLASGGRDRKLDAQTPERPLNQAVLLQRFPAPEGAADRRARPGVRRVPPPPMKDGPMAAARLGHSMTPVALPEGAGLLLFGGEGGAGPAAEVFSLPRVEFRALDMLALQEGDMRLPVPTRRGHVAAPLRDGRVLIVGGTSGGAMMSRVEDSGLLIDVRTQTATLRPGLLSTPRHGAAISLVGEELVICGGLGADGRPLATCDFLSVESGLRTREPAAMPRARAGHLQLHLETGQLLLVGGIGSDGQMPSVIDLYTPL